MAYKFNIDSTGTKTLKTAGKYMLKDVSIFTPAGSCTVSGGGLSKGTASGGGLLSGGDLSKSSDVSSTITINSSDKTISDATLSSTKPSDGYYLKLDSTPNTTKVTITRSDIIREKFSQTVYWGTYTVTHEAGFIPAGSTTYEKNDTTVTLDEDTLLESGTIDISVNGAATYLKIPASTIGSATANTTATAASTITSGKQVTVSKGYYPSDRIIRAAAATAASGFSLSITDKSTAVTVGALSNGSYPLTTSLTGTFSASTAGTFSSGSATDSSVKVGTIPAGSCTVSGGGLTAGSGSASLSSSSNVTLSTDNNGISVTATGSGTVNRAAITDAYSAGYIPAKSASTVSDLGAISKSSNSATQTKYITAINIPGETANFTVTNSGYLTVTNNGGMSVAANSGEVLVNTSATSDAYIGLTVSSSNANVIVSKNAGTIRVDSNTGGIINISDSAGGTIRWGNWEITMDSSGNLVYTYAS